MFGLPSVSRVGSAIERFSHAIAPGPRPRPQPSNDAQPLGWQSRYLHGTDVIVGAHRTIAEARIANARAREARREANVLGPTVGGTVALALCLWLQSRGGRK